MDEFAYRHQVSSDLGEVIADVDTIEDYLRAVMERTPQLIGVDGSYGISTVVYGHLMAVASSDRDAWDADQVEFDTKSGPCVDALEQNRHTHVENLEQEPRWPAWTSVALLLGFRSAAGLPAEIGGSGQRIALNAYGRSPGAFAGEPLRRAELLVEEIARQIPGVLRIVDQAERITDLESALASRSTIDQALGVLMAQNRCSRDEAFGILRRGSQNANIKLRDLASTLIERFTGHAAQPPAEFGVVRTRRSAVADGSGSQRLLTS